MSAHPNPRPDAADAFTPEAPSPHAEKQATPASLLSNADPFAASLDGRVIGERARQQLGAAYRRHGGSFAKPSFAALQRALRDVRRKLEGVSGSVEADEITRREDVLENWLAGRGARGTGTKTQSTTQGQA